MDSDRAAPSNARLAERLARVEEAVARIDGKIDRQSDTLNRVATQIDDDLETHIERFSTVEEQTAHLWLIYTGAKWLTMIGSGSGLLAFGITFLVS